LKSCGAALLAMQLKPRAQMVSELHGMSLVAGPARAQ
jgi:hypothetical protein